MDLAYVSRFVEGLQWYICNKIRKALHKHLLSVLIRMRKYFIGLFMLCGFDIIKVDLFEIHTSYCMGIQRAKFVRKFLILKVRANLSFIFIIVSLYIPYEYQGIF